MPPRQRRPATPAAANRVVLYVRVSDLMGRGGEDFHSPDIQITAMRRMAATTGLHEIAIVQDIDVTGRTFSREGLDKIRTMVEQRTFDVLAVYDLARLGRNQGEALRYIHWLRENNIRVMSTVEQIQDTPEGQFMLGTFLGMAELYSNQVSRRWSEVIAHRARKGLHHGTAPLGYTRDEAGGVHEDPALSGAVKRAFLDYANGVPISEVTRRFSRARGKATHLYTVKRILNNPFYTGKVVLWGVDRSSSLDVTTAPSYVGDGRHPRLVDDDVFEQVQLRLQRDSYTVTRHLAISHSLVGLVVCAHCEAMLQLHVDARGGVRTPRLRCGRQLGTKGVGCGGPGTPPQVEVESAAVEQVRHYVSLLTGDVDEQARALRRAVQANGSAADVATAVTRVREQMTRLTQAWLDGRVPDSAYDAKIEELRAAEDELSGQLEVARLAPRPLEPAQVVALSERLLRVWPDATAAERNYVLRQVVRRVVVRRAESYREPVADRVRVEFL